MHTGRHVKPALLHIVTSSLLHCASPMYAMPPNLKHSAKPHLVHTAHRQPHEHFLTSNFIDTEVRAINEAISIVSGTFAIYEMGQLHALPVPRNRVWYAPENRPWALNAGNAPDP